jgi:hypothetical protein
MVPCVVGRSWFSPVVCSYYVFGTSTLAEKVSGTIWAPNGWRWKPRCMRIMGSETFHSDYKIM